MADNFRDDFEFKPLTDGLGFHKKIIDLKENTEKFEMSANPKPLWNPALKSKDILEKKIQKPVVVRGEPSLEPVATGWPGAIFDSTMVLGLVLIFSAVIFAVTRIDFGQLVEMLQTEGTAQLGAIALLISVYEIYTVACRTFFGKTVGE
jgi:hypothetical protein